MHNYISMFNGTQVPQPSRHTRKQAL